MLPGDATPFEAVKQTQMIGLSPGMTQLKKEIEELEKQKQERAEKERLAREKGEDTVSEQHVTSAGVELGLGAPA